MGQIMRNLLDYVVFDKLCAHIRELDLTVHNLKNSGFSSQIFTNNYIFSRTNIMIQLKKGQLLFLWPISQHLLLRTAGFHWSKILMAMYPS